MTTIAVVGASGFVGGSCSEALVVAGAQVIPVEPPRLSTQARTPAQLRSEADGHPRTAAIAAMLAGADVVLNCAGVAEAGSAGGDALFGANALLPLLIGSAARQVGAGRFVHISSAAVQGRRPVLDESSETEPFSPYSESKALAELGLPDGSDVTILRPTSVHGPTRPVTRRLAAVARSRCSSVAGRGERPTPQVHVGNAAAAAAFLCTYAGDTPRIVLQPWEGWFTGPFLEMLGGHAPHHVPESVARGLLRSGMATARLSPALEGQVRRGEMLLFGQDQEPGWLASTSFTLAVDHDGWRRMAGSL